MRKRRLILLWRIGSPTVLQWLPLLPIALIALLSAASAQAQTCSAAASALTFPSVSPINRAAVNATGSINISCTWPAITLTPNALVCLNLVAFTPNLTNGGNALAYNLFTDAARALPWGSAAAGTTPISVILSKPAVGLTASTTVNYYGQVSANQPTVPTVNNSDTIYSQTIGGAQTAVNVGGYLLAAPTCASLTTSSGTFPFSASATVINHCTISATNLAFGTSTVLSSPVTGVGSLNIQCTNGDAYKISLSSGSGTLSARTMQRSSGGGTVAYQLYTNTARTLIWGDGSAGTNTVSASGTGNVLSIPVYGTVPVQTTPPPGNYSDTITATIVF